MKIVQKVNRVFRSQQRILEDDVEDWYEILYGIVPIDELNSCYVQADRAKTDDYAVKPRDLVKVWNAKKAAELKSTPCAFCRDKEKACPFHSGAIIAKQEKSLEVD